MSELLTLDRFTPLVGRAFRLSDEDSLEIVLTEATRLSAGNRPADSPREPFELIFKGPAKPILPQRIYRMEADGSPPWEIFIVPIGPLDGGMGYQAIFN